MKERRISFHVDMDSPRSLLKFWGSADLSCDLDKFYDAAMGRTLDFFRGRGIPATFFCVGEDLELSRVAGVKVKEAHDAGHEIANHTYSHPYGLTKLCPEELEREIEDCSKAIRRLTGSDPVGFRAPGYDVNARVLEALEKHFFEYDSSSCWTLLTPFIKSYHKLFSGGAVHGGFGENSFRMPREPYFPNKSNWKERGAVRRVMELPMARSSIFQMPFYNCFHLLTHDFYRKADVELMRQEYVVYLFHLVEFCDLGDGIPERLAVHPNVSAASAGKIIRMKDTVDRLLKRYQPVRTDRWALSLREQAGNRLCC